ncbi:Lsr2 family protein [Streptomyces sp. NRRL F-4428]|uniref:Lsr2 family protein n=1 Tax=Streptomyces sp. NRRL F-4428 TaxID=1609137 RepID=UPI000AFC9676|nr:Lsr2 family protein [Streptomyces sp. NRRL F-4428]
MRKTVLIPVLKTLCDAHLAKDGSEEEATDTLALGVRTWDLCGSHAESFGLYLVDALGSPEDGAADPDPVALADVVPVGSERDDVAEGAVESDAVRSVMIAGEVPGYDWETAREAVRNLGYEVVGRADDSTVLLIVGEGGDRNATKLRDAAEHGVPCMDVRAPGRFKDAVCAGELVGGDPLPEPAKVDRSGMSTRERNRLIRRWARENGWPNLRSGACPAERPSRVRAGQPDSCAGKSSSGLNAALTVPGVECARPLRPLATQLTLLEIEAA